MQRFKEKCEICKQWKNCYKGFKGMIVCNDCIKKNNGKFELNEPEQLTIFNYKE